MPVKERHFPDNLISQTLMSQTLDKKISVFENRLDRKEMKMKDECPGNRKATYFSSSHGQERKETLG